MGGHLRSYDDPCGIARALDRIGERWALLVVRELVLGPKRFSELRTGLPGASPNVLSQRLRELEACGAISKRPLPPPDGPVVYELTPWGRDLEPVILALARWGSRATPLAQGELSPDALMLALKTTFDSEAAAGVRARLELRLERDRYCVQVTRGELQVSRGACERADATITTDAAGLRGLCFAKKDLASERRAGRVGIEGDEATAARFLTLFRRPTPVDAPRAPG
jgi:DNA-binding HxlR family transcriptional regulator